MHKILFIFLTALTLLIVTACTNSNEAKVSEKQTKAKTSGKCQISKCSSDKQYKMR